MKVRAITQHDTHITIDLAPMPHGSFERYSRFPVYALINGKSAKVTDYHTDYVTLGQGRNLYTVNSVDYEHATSWHSEDPMSEQAMIVRLRLGKGNDIQYHMSGVEAERLRTAFLDGTTAAEFTVHDESFARVALRFAAIVALEIVPSVPNTAAAAAGGTSPTMRRTF